MYDQAARSAASLQPLFTIEQIDGQHRACTNAGSSGSTAAAPSPTSSAAPRRRAASRTSCCRENPEQYRDAAVAGIRRLLGLRAGEPITPDAGRVREDGHHGRHQRAARAQGRADAAGHHARLSRRAAHRLPGPAAPVRPPHRAARAALRARGRGRRARRRRRRGGASRSTRRALRARAAGARSTPACAALRHRLHARLPLHRRTSRRPQRWRARSASRRSACRTRSAR